MFEKASRLKLRFEHKGLLSIEDLWDLNVQDLDKIFKVLNAQAKAQSEESLLDVQSAEDVVLALKLDIVKHVVKVKLEEAEARKNAAANRAKKQKYLEILGQKQNEELLGMTVEKLQELIAGLEE